MKQNLITIVITILIIALPIAIIPNETLYNLPKIWILAIGGITLLILLLVNYKKLKLDIKDYVILAFAVLVFSEFNISEYNSDKSSNLIHIGTISVLEVSINAIFKSYQCCSVEHRRKFGLIPGNPHTQRIYPESQCFYQFIKQFIQFKAVPASFVEYDLCIKILCIKRRDSAFFKRFQIFKRD